jgi:hypothetical protein
MMSAQERELGKNYIGILCEATEEQRTLDLLPKSDRLMKDYFLDLVAAMLRRQRAVR